MPLAYNELRGRIVAKYGSMSRFSVELGVPLQSISRKINGKIGFSKEDILKWCELLEIDASEIGFYFFT